MFTEKYRPRCINDIIIDTSIKNKLQKFINERNIPNMIFSGTCGIGKSLLTRCIAHDVYGIDTDQYSIYLNASMDKTNNRLQEILDQFCRRSLTPRGELKMTNRMVIFDDIDYIPKKIQTIVASCMEKYINVCFIMTCTDVSEIMDVIQSRSRIFHMIRPDVKSITLHLAKICTREQCKYSQEAIERICFLSQCDIRMTLNILQTLVICLGNVSMINITKVCDVPSVEMVSDIIVDCIQNNISSAINKCIDLINKGYTGSDILASMFDVTKSNIVKLQQIDQISIMYVIGKTMYKISRRIDSQLQLEKCMISMCKRIQRTRHDLQHAS